jgi:hypothetical protein
MKRFYGKYRGTVEKNVDLSGRGRVQVSVPKVFGSGKLVWAEPCVPYAGDGVGFFAVPPEKAKVWVEFAEGNPEEPVLAGCYWLNGQSPGPGKPDIQVWKAGGITITLNNASSGGGLTIEVGSPTVDGTLSLALNKDGITLSNGTSQTVVVGKSSVKINNDGLEVK